MWTENWQKQDTPRTCFSNQPTPKRFNRTAQPSTPRHFDCNRSTDSATSKQVFQRTPSRERSRRQSPSRIERVDTEPTIFSSSELALRQAEVMLLEDDNQRLKQQLQAKDDQYAVQRVKRESQHRNQIQQLRSQITQLQEQLKAFQIEVKALKSAEASRDRQIKSLQYEKKQLEKQLEEAYQRKITDKGRQLMSYREAALQRKIEELQGQLKSSRSDLESKLESELAAARQQIASQKQISQGLSIRCRLLGRKLSESHVKYHQKIEAYKQKGKELQRAILILKEQMKKKRSQLNRTVIAQSYPTSPHHSDCSEKSLTFSSEEEWF